MLTGKLILFLRGVLIGAFLFSIVSMDKILDPTESFSILTLAAFGLASLLLGYCSVKFSAKFWNTWGFEHLSEQ